MHDQNEWSSLNVESPVAKKQALSSLFAYFLSLSLHYGDNDYFKEI